MVHRALPGLLLLAIVLSSLCSYVLLAAHSPGGVAADHASVGPGGLQPRRRHMRRRLVDVGDLRPLDPNNPEAAPKPLPNNVPNPNGDQNGIPLTEPNRPRADGQAFKYEGGTSGSGGGQEGGRGL